MLSLNFGRSATESASRRRKMMKKLGAALMMTTWLLASCQGSKEAYDQAFVKSWRESFIKSCVGSDEAKRDTCTCVADKSVEEMTVSQLSSPSESIKIIQEKIIPQCQAQ
jgi:hypothetical protein